MLDSEPTDTDMLMFIGYTQRFGCVSLSQMLAHTLKESGIQNTVQTKLYSRNNALGISSELNNTTVCHERISNLWRATDHENNNEIAPASDYSLIQKSSGAVYMHICETYNVR